MSNPNVIPLPARARGYTGRARVDAAHEGAHYFVLLTDGNGPHRVGAELAVAGAPPLSHGDEVLVTGGDPDGYYIVGLLGAARSSPASCVQHLDTTEGPAIRLRARDGTPVLEYLPEQGRVRLLAGSGDIDIVAQAGNIRMHAERELQISAQQVAVLGQERIQARVTGHTPREAASELTMDQYGVRGKTPQTEWLSHGIKARFHAADLVGHRLFSSIEFVRTASSRVEHTIQTLMENTVDVFRDTSRLIQTRAGRLRTVVAETVHLKAKRVIHKAEGDYKVRADKIHLG